MSKSFTNTFCIPALLAFALSLSGCATALRDNLTAEETEQQTALLQQQASHVLKHEGGDATQAYFIGAALNSKQDVFRNEVLLARQLFDKKWHTKDHSLVLVNQKSDDPITPLASRENLAYAIKTMAHAMDREHDILVLDLSSHGFAPPSHGVLLSVPGVKNQNLRPAWLKKELDNAKIKWRVIVVSACYSGGFIDTLKDDNTLLITASDAQHPSFGCSFKYQYTYFGDAFFAKSFMQQPSIEEAYRATLSVIADLEKRTFETPSNPQLFIGEAMRHKLQAFETSL